LNQQVEIIFQFKYDKDYFSGGNMKKNVLALIIIIISGTLFMSAYSSKLEEKLFYNQGFFGAAFLYQTYFNIGMASDSWTNNTYTPQNTRTILQASTNFLDISIKTLNELIQFSISIEDRNTLLQMIDIARDLKNQSSFMTQYIDTRNKQDLDNYEYYRQEAWKKISTLMDLK
jgi:hypothetical protein